MIRAYARRSIPWLPLLVGLSTFAMFNRGVPWRGEWGWSLDAVTGSTVLLGPGASALAAWLAAGDRPRRPVTDPLRRAWAVVALDVFFAWCAAVAVLMVGAVIAFGLDLTTTHGGPARVGILLLPIVVLAFYCALGATIGWFCPLLIAVVGAPIVSFAIGVLGVLGVIPNVLRLGPSTGSLAGVTWDRTVALSQGLTAGGLTVALIVGCTQAVRLRSLPALAAFAAGVAVAVGGLAILQVHGDERFVPSNEQASICVGAAPQVCSSPSNQRSLASLSSEMHLLAKALSKTGAVMPTRFVQLMPRGAPSPTDGYYYLSAPNATSVPLEAAARSLVRPAACPQWFGEAPPPAVVFEAQELIAQWLVARSGGVAEPYGNQERGWLRGHLAVQGTWIRGVYQDLRSCNLSAIRMPWATRS